MLLDLAYNAVVLAPSVLTYSDPLGGEEAGTPVPAVIVGPDAPIIKLVPWIVLDPVTAPTESAPKVVVPVTPRVLLMVAAPV